MADKEDCFESADLRRQPKQSRSVETRNAILEAAERLFSDHGYESTTTHQIAKEAGVSVGALYRYFADKEAVLKEIYRIEISGLRNRILGELSIVDIIGKDVRQIVKTAMSLAFRSYGERPGILRVLSEQSRKIPELAVLRRTQEEELHAAVLQLIKSYPGVKLEDRELGSYLASLFMQSLIEDAVLYRRDPQAFDDDRLIDGAADFVVRYLIGEEAEP